jgi:hypothetical protein
MGSYFVVQLLFFGIVGVGRLEGMGVLMWVGEGWMLGLYDSSFDNFSLEYLPSSFLFRFGIINLVIFYTFALVPIVI